MAYIYFNNNGSTSCVKTVTTQPSGHYIGVNVNGNAEYVKLANNTSGKMCVNIGGSTYSTAEYPENTDFLITPDFICKRRASTETLCIYANGTQIMSTSGTGCNDISIPDNAVITICGPYSGCYSNWTLNDGYLALNFAEQDACFRVDATALATCNCGYVYNSAVDGEGCNYVCSVSDTYTGAIGSKSCITVSLLNTTTSHCYNGSFTIKANNGLNVYTTCTTAFSGNAPNVFEVNFPTMAGMCMYDNDRAYASYIGLEFNGRCFINSTECPRMYCCEFVGSPNGSVSYPSGTFWWSGNGAGNHCLEFKDYSFTRCTI